IVTYALDKLRSVELQHEADPREIFGELIGRLIAAEYKIQVAKSERDEASAMVQQFREVIDAIWGGTRPAEADHAATLKRAETVASAWHDILNGKLIPAEFYDAGAAESKEPGDETHYAGAQPEGASTESPEGP
ncbi:MAG: hypothetical protein IID54_06630, partial [Proteobacteria bacterium]|nr:hypothetical protein [Pseudomonadota bacterium]